MQYLGVGGEAHLLGLSEVRHIFVITYIRAKEMRQIQIACPVYLRR